MSKWWLFLLLLLASCQRTSHQICPQINYTIQDRYLKQLPSPFPELGLMEKNTDWGKEYLIGIHFAKNLDLYRAITAFRRAEILAPKEEQKRKLEMQYEILLCYYLGKRYEEVDRAFTDSSLAYVGPDFPAYRDLLIILYDTYQQLNDWEKACHILEILHHQFPETYNDLALSSALEKADFSSLSAFANTPPERPYLNQMLSCYESQKKSPSIASFLNAILPGSGYLYLGQRQTAVTAFLVNGLFIAASVHFFIKGPIAAGIITTSFEAGWYFGGIYGAAQEAKFYNERLYEQMVTPMMNQEKLFPIFMLKYSF